jgi:hypothetical protein
MKLRDRSRYGKPQVAISAIRARGAITGQKVQYVLGFSLAAIVAAFVIVYLFHFL